MEKDTMCKKRKASRCSTVLEHLPRNPKADGLSPPNPSGARGEKKQKDAMQEKRKASKCSAVLEHLPRHPKADFQLNLLALGEKN